MRPTLRQANTIIVSVAMLIAAIVLFGKIPTRLESYAPLAVRGGLGQTLIGRNSELTVAKALITKTSVKKGASATTEGVWVFVDLTFVTRTTTQDATVWMEADGAASREHVLDDLGPGIPVSTRYGFDVLLPFTSVELVVKMSISKTLEVDVPGWPIDTEFRVKIPRSAMIERPFVEISDRK